MRKEKKEERYNISIDNAEERNMAGSVFFGDIFGFSIDKYYHLRIKST